MERVIPVIGLVTMLIVCYVFSNNRSKINWKLVLWGVGLQFLFAFLILKTAPGRSVFELANNVVQQILNASNEGTKFVFGNWGNITYDSGHPGEVAVQHRFENFYKADFKMTTLKHVRFHLVGTPQKPLNVPLFDPNEQVVGSKEISSRRNLITYLQKNQAVIQSQIESATHLVVLFEKSKTEAGDTPEAIAKKLEVPVIEQEEFQKLLSGLGQRPFFQGANFVFFPQIMGTIILVSVLMSVLFYFGIMQVVVRGMAWVMMKTMGSSGAESLAAAANVFVGQTEAPIVIGPYLKTMTKAELLSLMVGGLATIAGGVMVAYVALGVSAGHLLAASVMSAPATLLVAKMLYPETEEPVTRGQVKLEIKSEEGNVLEAAARGCTDGLSLAFNVMAMLIGFIAAVAVLNMLLSLIPLPGGGNLSFEKLMAWIFYPFAWLMGITPKDIPNVAQLLGVKIVLNEFIAYLDMSRMQESLDPRSFIIATYALCGFANFSSIGIQIGGISALAKERRSELAQLGVKALIGGTIACYMTACIAGILTDPAESYLLRGKERVGKGNFSGAIEDFNEAIELKNDFTVVYNERGLAKSAKGLLNEALADFDEVIKQDAKHSEAYNNRGLIKARQGKLKEAILDYEEALKIKPKFLQPLYNLGVAKFNFGNKEEAKADFRKYLDSSKLIKDKVFKANVENILSLFPELKKEAEPKEKN